MQRTFCRNGRRLRPDFWQDPIARLILAATDQSTDITTTTTSSAISSLRALQNDPTRPHIGLCPVVGRLDDPRDGKSRCGPSLVFVGHNGRPKGLTRQCARQRGCFSL
ncbi:hypothetical protein AMAG_18149 [Allomyces macrogynus ATCC 38327]|uniref:Uncharacterized protein n=1 Tax=Allomyces macrogynus (strain ATCC 38327) TaxID=578462 RepID=A0A0L0SA20_ALLM3|nr:hypothetical protein AMAG_18149 [Allomyces macrogynus ATCC 38327]|eukprot:KNE59316.1 hypothetical protein AMAG_18149 [Allomyces macrogynus ATCC 38327]